MKIERGNLGGGRLLKMAGIAVLAFGAIWLIPKILDEAGVSGDPWTFKETLPQVTDDFGESAKVVSISDLGGAVTFTVIGDDGQVHERRYYVETSESRGPQGQPAQGRSRETEDSERAATAEETAAATVTLGDLDEDVVERMWDEVGFPTEGSSAALTRTEWALSSGARPFDKYLANADGTNVRQTSSKESTFGGAKPSEGGKPSAPGATPGQGQVEALQKLGDCLKAAGSDIAAIQKCQATAAP